MRRLGTEDYPVDAVTMAKALVGAWLCRRFDDGTVVRRRITETEAYCGGQKGRKERVKNRIPNCRYYMILGFMVTVFLSLAQYTRYGIILRVC